jgi:S1-C subfamily serine protease
VFGAACAQVAGRGLQVASLVPNSPAALVEVDPGDIILDVNGQSVTTTDEYYQAVRQSDDEMQFTVLNVRTGRPLGMIVQLDR